MDFIVLSNKPLSSRELFLQEAMNTLANLKAEKLAVVAILPGNETMTAYFHMGLNDKLTASGHIQMDALTDYFRVNRDIFLSEDNDE